VSGVDERFEGILVTLWAVGAFVRAKLSTMRAT